MQVIDCTVRRKQTLTIEPSYDQRRAATDTCCVWYLAAVIRHVKYNSNIPPKSKHQLENCNIFTAAGDSKSSNLNILVKLTEMANEDDEEFTKT